MRRVFVDMDGVLCEYRPEAVMSDYESEGYFGSLGARTETVEAVRLLLGDSSLDVYVLSAVPPKRRDGSVAEKNLWLDSHLPEIRHERRIFTLCGENKAEAVGGIMPGDVLIDDYSRNLASWVEAGGVGIKLLNEVNGHGGTFTRGPRVRVRDRFGLLRTLETLKPCGA